MSVAIERIINLALFLAAAREPVTAERIRAEVFGYPAGQDVAAFLRMFERDKKDLLRMGFSIVADSEGNYLLDAGATFSTAVDLTAAETAALRIASAALLDDPSFPFAADLRLALAKLAAESGPAAPAVYARLADEEPGRQGEIVAALAAAAGGRKRASFGYTNSLGASAAHDVEPFGLFLHDGRWYLVGRDVAKDSIRTYAVARMSDVTVNAARPETPDFERPDGFDVSRYARLPFQFGSDAERFTATLRFAPEIAWRASSLAAGQGTLEPADGGGVLWTIESSSEKGLLRFVIENGPGIGVVAPDSLAGRLRAGLAEVAALHG